MVTYFWILLIIGSGGVLLSIFILLFNFWRKALKYIFFSSLFLLCLLLGHLFVRSPEGFIMWQIDTEKWYQFASIFGAFLLVATLLFQIRSFRRQQVEAKFFEMIRYYRDNINEMEFENPYSKRDPPSVLKGRKVIVTIVKQFFLARNIIESLVDQNNWTYEDLINIGANTSYKKDKSILILELAYQFVFWGVSSENEDDCKSNLKAVYKSVIVDDIFNHLKSFPVFYSKLYKEKSVSCSIDFLRKSKLSGTNLAYCLAEMKLKSDSFNKSHVGFNKFFGGHQYHLGHYFRHLFQAVKFIDKQPSWLMSQDDKYEYLKTLRAQMSNYEQALLFINSLTQLGRKWEFDSIGKNFISNYHLIKNLPVNFIPNIKLQDYYPKVNFEWSVDITKTNTGMKMNFCEKIGNWTKGLSFWNLIYKKYKPEWLIITGFTFLLSIVSIAYPTYPGNINN